jgi:hypothetical protein
MSIPNPTVFASANTPLLAQAAQSASSASSSTSASASASKSPAVPELGYRLPENATLQTAVKWGIIEDKPIMMDYWVNSLEKSVLIGIKDSKEKLLVKSIDEYTSPISKVLKNNQDYILITENSIYLVDVNIPVKKIS